MELLLLPGLDGTGRLFEPLLGRLGLGIRATVVSYPEDRALGYDDLLMFVLDKVPSAPFVILGESFSGPLAVMAAARGLPQLRGLVLAASFVKNPVSPLLSALARRIPAGLLGLRPRRLLIRRAAGSCPRETIDWIMATMPRLSGDVLAARIRAVLDSEVTGKLGICPVPVLCLASSRDRVVGSKATDAIRMARPDAEVRILDGPHMILQCRPAEAAAAIGQFCVKVGGERP